MYASNRRHAIERKDITHVLRSTLDVRPRENKKREELNVNLTRRAQGTKKKEAEIATQRDSTKVKPCE